MMCETKRLAAIKKRNEEALTDTELRGKYRKAYESLCMELKEKQCELRTRYMEVVRELSELMADSVYLDPDDGMKRLHDEMLRRAEGNPNGSLVNTLFYAFWIFYTEQEGQETKK